MKATLETYARNLAKRFAVLNKWFEDKGLNPEDVTILFVNNKEEVLYDMYDGCLYTNSRETSVDLCEVSYRDIMDLTIREILIFIDITNVHIYTEKNDRGNTIYKNPLKLNF